MLPDDIAEFHKIVPATSVLGPEFELLCDRLATHKTAFESAKDKMDYDTSSYRRANMALEHFLKEWLPKCRNASSEVEASAKERMDILLGRAINTAIEKRRISIDRRSEARIWQHYALECYREKLPRKIRRLQWYNPNLVRALFRAWRIFRAEVMLWKYDRIQWDGSRAMHAMFNFIVQIDDLARSYD